MNDCFEGCANVPTRDLGGGGGHVTCIRATSDKNGGVEDRKTQRLKRRAPGYTKPSVVHLKPTPPSTSGSISPRLLVLQPRKGASVTT